MNPMDEEIRLKRITSQGSYKVVKFLMNEEATGNKTAMYDACESDPWFISDVHISINKKRTEAILNNIYENVGINDSLIFLGDLTDKHTGNLKLTREFIQEVDRENIFLIIGNNDYYTIGDYIDMGFVYVDDCFRFKKDNQIYILTHCPVPVGNGKAINIHGHLHGCGCYWNMNPQGHYDVFVGTDGEPQVIRFSDLIKN